MSSLRLSYQTLEFGDSDIHLRTLRDRQQYSDPELRAEKLGISSATWPLFGVVWPSSLVLAEIMMDYDIDGMRILEVGCGIGLASLVLNERLADITATDYHPEVEGFLQKNVELNNGRIIPFVRTGWGDAVSNLGEFDLIIGSDLLYERDHAGLLSEFIDQHSKPGCEVIIIDPARGHSGKFNKMMAVNGYDCTQKKVVDNECVSEAYRGNILHYVRSNRLDV